MKIYVILENVLLISPYLLAIPQNKEKRNKTQSIRFIKSSFKYFSPTMIFFHGSKLG